MTRGLDNWPALAGAAGLPMTGWTPRLLASRADAKGDRVVIRLDHPDLPPVICKQSFRQTEGAAMAEGAAAQTRAAAALAGHAFARAPRMLACLPDRAALLTEAVEGQTLRAVMGTAGQARALHRAGSWLDAFHRIGPVTPYTFRPRWQAERLAALAQAVRDGTSTVPDRDRFLDLVAAAVARAPDARGAQTVTAPKHGDLNAQNLILSGDHVWGIDFGMPRVVPVGQDIAQLLVFLSRGSADTAPLHPHLGLPADIVSAFFTGYSLTTPQDGALRFLTLVQLMTDWANLPATRAEMSSSQHGRFSRIAALAEAALGK